MNEFQVPTEPLAVEVSCVDGRSFMGHVFLPRQSSLHEGAMRAEEWANGPAAFFPFTPMGSEDRTVLNKLEVVAMSVAAEAGPGEPAGDPAGDWPLYHVVVEALGRRFEGTVVAEMPKGQQRVVDLLNGPEPFLSVRHDHRHHLIHKAHIVRVIEVREE